MEQKCIGVEDGIKRSYIHIETVVFNVFL